jgi:hypothetical protein
MSDSPSAAAKVFQYADDIAVTNQAQTIDECENYLKADIEVNFFIVGAFNRIQEKLKCAYSISTRMLPTNNWM